MKHSILRTWSASLLLSLITLTSASASASASASESALPPWHEQIEYYVTLNLSCRNHKQRQQVIQAVEDLGASQSWGKKEYADILDVLSRYPLAHTRLALGTVKTLLSGSKDPCRNDYAHNLTHILMGYPKRYRYIVMTMLRILPGQGDTLDLESFSSIVAGLFCVRQRAQERVLSDVMTVFMGEKEIPHYGVLYYEAITSLTKVPSKQHDAILHRIQVFQKKYGGIPFNLKVLIGMSDKDQVRTFKTLDELATRNIKDWRQSSYGILEKLLEINPKAYDTVVETALGLYACDEISGDQYARLIDTLSSLPNEKYHWIMREIQSDHPRSHAHDFDDLCHFVEQLGCIRHKRYKQIKRLSEDPLIFGSLWNYDSMHGRAQLIRAFKDIKPKCYGDMIQLERKITNGRVWSNLSDSLKIIKPLHRVAREHHNTLVQRIQKLSEYKNWSADQYASVVATISNLQLWNTSDDIFDQAEELSQSKGWDDTKEEGYTHNIAVVAAMLEGIHPDHLTSLVQATDQFFAGKEWSTKRSDEYMIIMRSLMHKDPMHYNNIIKNVLRLPSKPTWGVYQYSQLIGSLGWVESKQVRSAITQSMITLLEDDSFSSHDMNNLITAFRTLQLPRHIHQITHDLSQTLYTQESILAHIAQSL